MMTAQFQSLFWEIFEEAKMSPIGQTMAKTVEASPWHREANVWVHTEMCVNFYYQQVMPKVERTAKQQFSTMLALLFHDFGKPEAEETLEKKDGSGETYRRYAGHEPKSANEMISFLCERPHLLEKLAKAGVTMIDLRKIKVMIEHHLPYGMTNKTKRRALKTMIDTTLGDDVECFYDMLWSDCNGRISDDHEAKRQKVLEWTAAFKAEVDMDRPKARVLADNPPILYVLIGASGSGKSTWTEKFAVDADKVSLDTMRFSFYEKFAPKEIMYYGADWKLKYNMVFKFAVENSAEFDRYVDAEYSAVLARGRNIVVDNTNTTRKSRSKWINKAKDKGYQIVAIEFYVAEKTLHERQSSRPDKEVPGHAVHRQFMSIESAWLGAEVDSVSVQ